MDIDKLMKNDELSSTTTTTKRPCTKESDPKNNCHCASCMYQNGIMNPKDNFLNDEKSLTSLAQNSLNQQQHDSSQFNTMNSSPTNSMNHSSKKGLNPLGSIKNFITSTTAAVTNHQASATTNSSTKHNSINNSLNNSICCLNHSNHSTSHSFNSLMVSKENHGALIKAKYQESDLNSPHINDDTLHLFPNSNEWYSHCHQNNVKTQYSERSESANRRLLITTILCFFFLITELVGGYISNSLSIMTDAAHLLSDLVSFGLSLFAVYLSKKRATKRFTFGYQRAEILGAICSILLIWLLTAVVVYFAIVRIITMDFEIESTVMMIVALFGIAVNIMMGITLHGCMCPGFSCMKRHSPDHDDDDHYQPNDDSRQLAKQANNKLATNGKHHHIELEVVSSDTSENGINLNKIDAQKKLASIKKKSNDHHSHRHGHHSHDHDSESINVRAAIIHVLGDLIQSIGVFVAALIIHFKPEWKAADPICTFLFSIIVLFTTVRIMKESILIIIESAPDDVDHQQVKLSLLNINGVQMVHNLNIWQLTVENVVLCAHLVVSSNCNIEQVLQKARILLKEKHNITRVTVQCERYQPQIMLACDSCNEL